MPHIRYRTATDREILRDMGSRLAALREAVGLTQMEASERAGIGRSTLHRAEHGENPTLHTVVRLLRVYGRLEALAGFIPEPPISPMERLRQRRERGNG
jgi:transcriptional regulator with XRE-family HTH domain